VSKFKRKVKDFIKLNIFNFYKKSYAQCGEDMILDCIFRALNIKNGTYLDIGAHHPYYFSNTQFLYEKGFSGVNCEPNPYLHNMFLSKRKRDTNLNIGISIYEEDIELDFYIMDPSTLSTFVKSEAERYSGMKIHKIDKIQKVQTININKVIDSYFDACPNFISIDVEGLDYDILKTFDFEKYNPEVFCIEVAEYNIDGSYKRIKEIDKIMKDNGYFIYADMFQNAIYVFKDKWNKRINSNVKTNN
jgi:FkbM family methyltransferase